MNHEILHVQMFGKFAMRYGTRTVTLNKAGSAKSVRLLQMLLLSGSRGISKNELLDSLYGWSEQADTGNRNKNLNNVIYRLRNQLVNAGLPEMDYIIIKDGTCYWNEKIPVELDTEAFERAYRAALSASGKEQLALYRKANEIYYGELLPTNLSDMWFYERSIYFKELYMKTVRFLSIEYRKIGNYKDLTEIYIRAAAIYPFDNWQTELIRTYLDMYCYDEALKVYNETMELYAKELGTPPTEEMQQCFEMLRNKGRDSGHEQRSAHGRQSADQDFLGPDGDITRAIFENGKMEGAYYCAYPSFVDHCRLLMRSRERTGIDSALIFLALNQNGKRSRLSLEGLNEQMALLREAIKASIRRGDAFTRYGNRYYILMLTGADKAVCSQIFRRIEFAYSQMPGSKGELWYHAAAMQDLEKRAGGQRGKS